MWLTIALAVVVILLVVIALLLSRNYGTIEKSGYPVIPPKLCFGSGPFMFHDINMVKLDTERVEKYGKIFGSYILSSPWVFVADPEIIKQITIKDFDHFPSHQFQFMDQKYRSLESTSGEEWKELRRGMSPVFTSGKIKSMIKLIDGALDNMMAYLRKEVKINAEMDMAPVLKCLTMDAIGLCAFAVNLNCFENRDNPIFVNAREAFAEFRATDVKSSLQTNMELGMVGLEKYVNYIPTPIVKIWDYVKQIQDNREKSGEKYGDFVDKLAELKETITKNGVVTNDQLTAQGMIFFLAGYETTAHAMGALIYLLVKNPQVYDKLEAEIDEVTGDSDHLDHDKISELPYLEACIKEAMRLIPAVGRNDRKCVKDWEFNGYKIKKGTYVGLMNYVVHHNPEYWPEPELFKPERFLKENAGNIVPCSYLPFGSGPRACIGERFAMVEMKLAMAKLLQNFRLEATDNTRMEFLNGELLHSSYKDVTVKVIPRN